MQTSVSPLHSRLYHTVDHAAYRNYDANAKQLADLKTRYPEDFERSRYYEYFHDYCSEEDGTVNTSGFDLLERVRKKDKDLHRRLFMDAAMALESKNKHSLGYC